MRVNLCEIIDMPGSSLPFVCELDTERIAFPAIVEFITTPVAKGLISNTAGVLSLTGKISCRLKCTCDRCGTEFTREMELPLDIRLAVSLEDKDNPDIFLLDGDWLDLSDVIETCFILGTGTKFLCREDCAGLCDRCGKNLNEGPCGCGKEIDPRLAVLQQLLDKKEIGRASCRERV